MQTCTLIIRFIKQCHYSTNHTHKRIKNFGKVLKKVKQKVKAKGQNKVLTFMENEDILSVLQHVVHLSRLKVIMKGE